MKLLKAICIVCICALLASCNSVPDNTASSSSKSESTEISSSESSKSSSSCGENTEKIIVEGSYLEHLYKKDIKSINCHNATAAAILNDGSAVFWGSNVYGGIGNGSIDLDLPHGEKAMPTPPYRFCFGEPVVAAGSQVCSYALTESGTLYMWGMNNTYRAGLEGDPILVPTKITSVTDIKQVSTSTEFTLALKGDGTVYHTGTRMELFKNSHDYDWRSLESEQDKTFTKMSLDFKCKKIDTSGLSYVFLSDKGDVYIQGILFADINAENPDLVFKAPTKIDFPEKIVDIAALAINVVALSETGNVYVFGCPGAGASDKKIDICISDLIYQKNLENIKGISGNCFTVGALSENGEIYVWGIDEHGVIKESNVNLQRGQLEIVPEPVKLDYQNIIQFCIGIYDGTAISENGDVYIWGSNSIGQIIEFE